MWSIRPRRTQWIRSRKEHDPVFAPWHALADLPERDFAARAGPLIARFAVESAGCNIAWPINPIVTQGLAYRPPKSLADAASDYASLLQNVEQV
jgi:hypothetical protein